MLSIVVVVSVVRENFNFYSAEISGENLLGT